MQCGIEAEERYALPSLDGRGLKFDLNIFQVSSWEKDKRTWHLLLHMKYMYLDATRGQLVLVREVATPQRVTTKRISSLSLFKTRAQNRESTGLRVSFI